MSELPVTEDQRRRLEAVCDDLEDAFVGPYGSVTPADALEYLLDTYTPPEEVEEVEKVEESTEDADAAGSASRGGSSPPVAVGTTDRPGRNGAGSSDRATAGSDATGEEDLTAIPGVGDVTADALSAAGFDSASAIRAADPEALTEAEGVGEKQAIDISAAVEELEIAAGSDGGPGGDEGDPGGGDGGGGPDENAAPGSVSAEHALQQAQSLLDAHADRWREGSGDEPYEVDLPDGSTEGARTKDDVKRLLFKHWR